MHQRVIFCEVRPVIGEQLLLKDYLYKVNQKRAKKLTRAHFAFDLLLTQGINQ
jgi:hypothetical protein